MATFVTLRHPVTILVTDFTYPDNSHSQLIEFLYLFVSESIILHVKNVFFLGKTLEEFWCKPKKHIFASFFHLFTFFMQKTWKMYILNIVWSVHHPNAGPNIQHATNTTYKLNEMGLVIPKLWLCKGCEPKQTTTGWKIMPYCF